LDVPQSSEGFKKHITTALHTAFLEATSLNPGPVHLNFPFREPFLPSSPVIIDKELKDPNLPSKEIIYPDSTIDISRQISTATRPLVIAGQDVTKIDIEPWLGNPSIPILCDSLSSTRQSDSNNTILRYENLLRDPQFVEKGKPDLIITLGPLPTSKTLRNWIKGLSAQRIVIEPRGINVDPIQSESKHFQIGFYQLEKINIPPPAQGWTEYWTEGEKQVQTKLDWAFEDELPAFEGKLAYLLSLHLPSDANLFVANSMPIRDLEWFWKKSATSRRLFGNRGVNGIDGTLGTALGMAQETSVPNFLLTGELAFLHDSNALLFANQFKGSLTVCVINNDGGGIFENLPIAKEPEFEKCFATPQSFDLSSLCKAFHVDYSLMSSWSQIIEKIIKPRDHGIEVIEIRTNRKQDRLTRNKLLALTPWKDA
jgi:2-succinyl-5-enolpyruvyl-6-hydroxy-3-cyclohexene-1-carboxylate synthase